MAPIGQNTNTLIKRCSKIRVLKSMLYLELYCEWPTINRSTTVARFNPFEHCDPYQLTLYCSLKKHN